MSIKSAVFGISTLSDIAGACENAGITAVDIRVQESEKWHNGRAKRTLGAVISIDGKDFTVVRDTYPHSLTPAEINSSMMLGPQRDIVLFKTLLFVTALEKQRGVKTSLIDGRSVGEVEVDLGIVRPGIERR